MFPHAWIEGFQLKIAGQNYAELAQMDNGNVVGAYFDESRELHNLMIEKKGGGLFSKPSIHLHPYTNGKPDPLPIGFAVREEKEASHKSWRIGTRAFTCEWPQSLKLVFTPKPSRSRAPFFLQPKETSPNSLNFMEVRGPYWDDDEELKAPANEDLVGEGQAVTAKDFSTPNGWVELTYEHEGIRFRQRQQRLKFDDEAVYVATVQVEESRLQELYVPMVSVVKSLEPRKEWRFFAMTCSFCSLDQTLAKKMISGPPPACICNFCVELFEDYIEEDESYDPAEFEGYQCGFCGKQPNEAKQFAISLVFDSTLGICDECVQTSADILKEENDR